MNREDITKYILETYHIEKEYPWKSYPNYAVFRHPENRKWFAVIMDLSRTQLGLQGDEILDAVNLKCDPVLIGTLIGESGCFPAYHMNKENWITLALDGSVSEKRIRQILDMSFELTAPKRKKKIN